MWQDKFIVEDEDKDGESAKIKKSMWNRTLPLNEAGRGKKGLKNRVK